MAIAKSSMHALHELVKRVEAIKRQDMIPKIRDAVGAALLKEVADEFRESRDPYGKPWAPVKRNRRKDRLAREKRRAAGKAVKADKPLIDTGRLRASAAYLPKGLDGIRIVLPVEYASYHQYGATIREHGRKGGSLAFDARGRIMRKNRRDTKGMDSVGVRFFGAYTVGSYKIPRRQILPDDKTGGLGPRWSRAANKAAAKVVADTFTKKR